jgi:two-component system, LuxR family, sensor kinase FixL
MECIRNFADIMRDFEQLMTAFRACHDDRCADRLFAEASVFTNCFITRHDRHGRYLRVSDGFTTMLQYTSDQVVNTSAYDYFHPDDLVDIMRSHQQVTLDSGIAQVRYRLRARNGSYINVVTLSKPIVNRINGDQEIITLTREDS